MISIITVLNTGCRVIELKSLRQHLDGCQLTRCWLLRNNYCGIVYFLTSFSVINY